MTLEEIIIDPSEITVNKNVYRRRLNTATLAFNKKIKNGARRNILPQEGELTIDAIETFWAAYGSVKEKLSKQSVMFGGKHFTDLYSLYVASSYTDEKFSKSIDEPKFYGRLLDLELNGDDYLLMDHLMRNFIYETNNCNSGKNLGRTTRGFLQRIQELARVKLTNEYAEAFDDFENSYSIQIGDSFRAKGASISTENPDAGKPNEIVTWEDIGGYYDIKEDVMFHCDAIQDERLRSLGYRPPKGMCFYGWPGTGKTLLAKAIACQIGMPFHKINVQEILSKWVGDTEKQMYEQLTREGVHFIDEADALFKKVEGQDSAVSQRIINMFAEITDGFHSNNNLYIMSTNSLSLDGKLKRAGRIDEFYHFGLPDEQTINHVYRIHAKKIQETANIPLFDNVDLDNVSRVTYMVSVEAHKKNPNVGIVPADCKNILQKTHNRMLRKLWKTDEYKAMDTNDVFETIKNYELEERAL
ncbi:ATP-binding protein [Candidatus Woesearchaeota archaeon]|nr:ATP-binding protein [Candidatus Woesearchaeota archaeon]